MTILPTTVKTNRDDNRVKTNLNLLFLMGVPSQGCDWRRPHPKPLTHVVLNTTYSRCCKYLSVSTRPKSDTPLCFACSSDVQHNFDIQILFDESQENVTQTKASNCFWRWPMLVCCNASQYRVLRRFPRTFSVLLQTNQKLSSVAVFPLKICNQIQCEK